MVYTLVVRANASLRDGCGQAGSKANRQITGQPPISPAAEEAARAYARMRERVKGGATTLLQQVQGLIVIPTGQSAHLARGLHAAVKHMANSEAVVLSDLRSEDIGSDTIPLVARSNPYEQGKLHTALDALHDAMKYLEARIVLEPSHTQIAGTMP